MSLIVQSIYIVSRWLSVGHVARHINNLKGFVIQ